MRLSLFSFWFFLGAVGFSPVHADDRSAPAITLYQNGLAFIQDTRLIPLKAAQTHVTLPNISPQILPDSLLLDIQGTRVVSRHFNFDTLTPNRLLNSLIGQTVTFINNAGQKTSGQLLAFDNQDVILKQADGRILSGDFGALALTEPDQSFITSPSLSAQIEPPATDSRSLARFGYLSNGFSWDSSYNLQVSPQGDQVILTPWATLTNTSGLDYQNVTLSLAAGHINRQRTPRPMLAKSTMALAETADSALPTPPMSLGSALKLYTIPTTLAILNNQTLQVPLMPTQTFKSVRTLVARFNPLYRPVGETQAHPIAPIVELRFTNTSDYPLPQGAARLYQSAADNHLSFIGEAALPQTSKGAEVALISGKSFDVSAEAIVPNWSDWKTNFLTIGC